jgi:hypothetical protein
MVGGTCMRLQRRIELRLPRSGVVERLCQPTNKLFQLSSSLFSPALFGPLCLLLVGAAPARLPSIYTDDVTRFFRVYDAAAGHPTPEQLQHQYLDPGSSGLHELARLRNVTGTAIAHAIEVEPAIYAHARDCMAVLPRVELRFRSALSTLVQRYPEANLPPVTIAVARTKPVAMADPAGVRIGLEALCATAYLNPNVEDRFVHVIAHEYAHAQQSPALLDADNPTVLQASLMEGVGEFTAELISGAPGDLAAAALARGHEKEIETRFAADESKRDLSAWLYNGTHERPGDLGYWVGYRIVKSYYQHHRDKRLALREIYGMTDASAFLEHSGWYPGIRLARWSATRGWRARPHSSKFFSQ